MNRGFSVYLDLVRFGAACLVYLYHSNQRWLVADVLPLSRYGHASVIVFFVLSGFVIAWVSDRKEREWSSYAASRLSRVFSVVVPALLLCLLLDGCGRLFWRTPYGDYPYDQLAVRLGASLLMLNEIWFVSITSLSNVPFWSITYEFWYYVLFGLVTFLPRRLRWWAATALLLLLGPKIALLAPIWSCGVLLYRWRALERIPLGWAWAMVLASTALIVGLHAANAFDDLAHVFEQAVGAHWFREFTFSKFFLGDYVLAALVFCHFAGMRRVAPQLGPLLDRIAGPVKWLAGYTFTLYLLHQPLFLFWGAVWHGRADGAGSWLVVTALCAASVLLVGHLTEQRRDAWRRVIEHQLRRLDHQRPAPAPHHA